MLDLKRKKIMKGNEKQLAQSLLTAFAKSATTSYCASKSKQADFRNIWPSERQLSIPKSSKALLA